MTRLLTIVSLLLLTVASALEFCTCPSASAQRSSFTGLWKGSSVCQIKDSPCHDEVAAYTVKKGNAPDSFEFTMNKVVDGQEELMGTLACKIGNDSNSLVCRQNDVTVWTWKLLGDSMSGTLIYRGQLYRKIQLTRAKIEGMAAAQ
jgi:hypothetical protein